MPDVTVENTAKNIGEVTDTQINMSVPESPLRDTTPPNIFNSFGSSFMSSIDNNQNQQSIIDEEKRLTNIDNASLSDKYWGLSATFDGSDVGGVIDYFKYDRGMYRRKDDKFLSTFDKEKEDMIIRSYGLNENSRPYIQEAKNYEHLFDLAEKEQLKTKALDKVMNLYTETESTIANLSVAVATDPSVVLTGGATYVVRGLTTLAKSDRMARILENASRTSMTASGLTTTSKYSGFASSTLIDMKKAADLEAKMMVADNVKKGLAKAVVGSSVSYGAVLGATNEDVTMLEGLITYGLLSPIDYKIINGLDTRIKVPQTKGLGKNTVDNKYKETMLLENKQARLTAPIKSDIKSEILALERQVKASTKLTNSEKEILKSNIRARLKTISSKGYKKLVKITNKIEAQIAREQARTLDKESKIFNSAKKLRVVKQEIEDIHDLARDIEMDITDVKKSMEVIAKTDSGKQKIARDVFNIYKAMHDGGYISKSAFEQIDYSFKKGKGKGFKSPKIEVEHTIDNVTKESAAKIKVNGRVVKVVGASALAASGLGAYDGADLAQDGTAIVGLGIVMALLGLGIKRGIQTGTVRQSLRNGVKRATQGEAYDDTRKIRSSIGSFFNSSRTSLTETVKPLLDNTTGAAKDFLNRLYFNPLDQTAQTIETTKRIFAHSKSQGLERELRDIFTEWREVEDISNVKNIASMFTDMSFRAKFNHEVWEHMTMGKHADKPQVVKGAKKVSEYYEQVLKDMKEAGVKNADKMVYATDNLMYVPRIHNGLMFANKITGISQSGKEALISKFSEMLTKTPEDRKLLVAREYIENMIKRDVTASKTFSKESREALQKELTKKGLEADEIEEVISAISGSYGRTKARIHMDYDKFDTVSVDINGIPTNITINDLFMTDISSLSNTLFNQAGGHVAFAANGYKSVDDAINIIKEANMIESHRAIALNDILATIGVPSIDYSQTANVVMKNIGNMAIARMMGFSTISLMSEGFIYAANTIRQSGLMDGMGNLTRSVRGFGDDSFIASDVPFGKDGLGLGQSKYSSNYGQFRTFDEFSNQDSGIGNWTKYSEMWRDFTLHTLPFSRTSDFIAKASMQDVMDRLYKHFDGSMPLTEHELSAFPITTRMENYLKKNLKLNDKGHVKFFDYTKADFKTKDEFKNLVDNMMIKRMNQTTLGTSGAYTRHSAAGVALSSMLKYPMSAYSNLGGFLGRGALQGDAFAMTQIALWFQAGMIQSMLRNEIQGKDYDDTDLLVAGLLNIPQYGLIGTVTGLGDSPTANMAQKMTDVIDIYSYAKSN